MKTHVIIYSRPGCRLCDDAKSALREANCEEYYVLEEVNIEGDAELLSRYQNDIPVITFDGVEVFRHRVKPVEFLEALRRHTRRDRI